MVDIKFTNVPIQPDWLNAAIFKAKDGSVVIIDREHTEWAE